MSILSTAKRLINQAVSLIAEVTKEDIPAAAPEPEIVENVITDEPVKETQKEGPKQEKEEFQFQPLPVKPTVAYMLNEEGLRDLNADELLEVRKSDSERVLLDITHPIEIWTRIMQKSAGNKLVIWSPDAVQSRATIQKGKLMEAVYMELPSGARHYAMADHLGTITKLPSTEVSSIHIDDMKNPKETTFADDGSIKDTMTFEVDPSTFQGQSEAPDRSKENEESFLLTLRNSCSPDLQNLLQGTFSAADLEQFLKDNPSNATDTMMAGILLRRLERAK